MAQLILDPHCRTLDGFGRLVDREWGRFGHNFERRLGAGPHRAPADAKDRAPIFEQWLDAVWQLWRQHPAAFEFGESFLLLVADAARARWFCTFAGDCAAEREARGASPRRPSLWAFVRAAGAARAHRNPCYRRTTEPVWPCCELGALEIWRALHLRQHPALYSNSPSHGGPTEAQALTALIARREEQIAEARARLAARRGGAPG